MPNRLILVSSDYSTVSQAFSESFRCSLENFRRACTLHSWAGEPCRRCRGTLQALQDFSPLRRSVTNGLLDDYGPNCLEIINKLLPCSSRLITHFSRSSLPHEVRSCMELQTEGDWWLFVFLPFPNNLSNSCLLLTKLLADGLVAHFSLV